MANESIGVSRIHTRKVNVNGIAAAVPTLFAYKVIRKFLTEFSKEHSNKGAVFIPTPGLGSRERAYEFTR